MKKKPEGGMHHICIEVSVTASLTSCDGYLSDLMLKVDDIKAAMKDLEGKVRTLTKEPKVII